MSNRVLLAILPIIVITPILIIAIIIFNKREKRKKLVPIEKLKKIENKLREYLSYTPEERLIQFNVLQKTLSRLYNLINEQGLTYEKKDILYMDQMHSEVGIVPFRNRKNEIDYLRINHHQMLLPEELKSVDESLVTMSQKWLNEIPIIQAEISVEKK